LRERTNGRGGQDVNGDLGKFI